jgi:hypothetical protein
LLTVYSIGDVKERECGFSGRKLAAENYSVCRKIFPDGKLATTIPTRFYYNGRIVITRIQFNVWI